MFKNEIIYPHAYRTVFSGFFFVFFFLHDWKIFHDLLKFPLQDLFQFDFWQLSFYPCTS